MVLALGTLHHMNDNEVLELLELAEYCLTPGGHFVSLDPCFVKNQSYISKLMIKNDRGQNVRTLNRYKELAGKVFNQVNQYHHNNLVRLLHLITLPYDHCLMICKKPNI